MKQIYVCEKCGATFDNWNDANQCEDGHVDSFAMEPEWNQDLEYAEGCAFPNEVVVRSKEWNWRTDKYEYKYFRYKIAGPLTKKRIEQLEVERIRKEEDAEANYRKIHAEAKTDQEAKAEQEKEAAVG